MPDRKAPYDPLDAFLDGELAPREAQATPDPSARPEAQPAPPGAGELTEAQKVALARSLARAALARQEAVEASAPTSAGSASAGAARASSRRSRSRRPPRDLAARAPRPLSAREAARRAAEAEARERAARAEREARRLPARLARRISELVGMEVVIETVRVRDDREVLHALARAHRIRLGAAGELAAALAAARVAEAARALPAGRLVEARVAVGDAGCRVFYDLEGDRLVAAVEGW